jgi:Ca2+-binding RTX toxin-like protein
MIVSWLAGGGTWNTPSKWSTNSIPSSSDDAVITAAGSYTVTISAPITAVSSLAIGNTNAALSIDHITTGLTSGNLDNAGFLNVDTGTPGSTLTVGGVLINRGTVNIGNQFYGGAAATTTVTAGALRNTGAISLTGNASFEPAVSQVILDIAGAAPSTLTGQYSLANHALLKFGSGSINTIAAGARLFLDGSHSLVANSSNTTSNSALSGLAVNGGWLRLTNGVSVATAGNFVNAGTVDLQDSFNQGGPQDNLTLGGALTNFGTMNLSANGGGTTVSATGFSNLGAINLTGNSVTSSAIHVAAAAPATLTGSLVLSGDLFGLTNAGKTLIEFASGSIAKIGAGATLGLFGPQAFLADTGNTNSNSALTGLTANAGNFVLKSGAVVSTSGNFVNTGTLGVDTPHYGGSNLTIAGTLTNLNTTSNAFVIGATDSPKATTVTVTGLNNLGRIDLFGSSATNTGSLTVNGAASNYGTVNINSFSKVNVNVGQSYVQNVGFTKVGGTLTAATVAVAGGEVDVTGALTAAVSVTGGTLQGTGTIVGNVSDTGGIVMAATGGSNAYVYPISAGSPGTLTVNGNFSETGASVVQVLRGTSAGQFGVINVTGSVTLQGGVLQVDQSGFNFAAGQTFTVFTFAPGSLTGTFARVQVGAFIGNDNSVNIGGGLTVNVVYNNAGGNIQLQVANTPATGDHWTTGSGTGLWTTGANWSTGVPGAADNAVIDAAGNYRVLINAPVSVGSIAVVDGHTTLTQLAINNPWNAAQTAPVYGPMAVTVAGSLTNACELDVDYDGPFSTPGGTTLTIGGTLSNGNRLTIGGGGEHVASTSVTAAGLFNTGQITLQATFNPDHPGVTATLNIGSAAGFGIAGTVTGTVDLFGQALLQFASGQLTHIAPGAALTLHNATSFVADAGSTGSNSALTGLSANAGTFKLLNGASVTTTTSLTNSGELDVDYDGPFAVAGGSALAIGGTLTNVATVNLGAGGITQAATLTAMGLSNTGNINLQGGTAKATLHVTGAAGFGALGTVTGNVSLFSNTLLEFGSGQIDSIASGASLVLHNNNGFVANTGSTNSNSALTGLSSNAGEFKLLGGAAVTTAGDFTNGGGLDVDSDGPFAVTAGSALAIGGTLTNVGRINIGADGMPLGTTFTMAGLINTGAIGLNGGATGLATMTVNGATIVGPVNGFSGAIYAHTGSALLLHGSVTNYGSIQALGGLVEIDGAVTGTGSFLISNGGTLILSGGASNAVIFTGAAADTLELASPASFNGPLAGFASGDVLRLDGITATSAIVNGSTMVVGTLGAALNFELASNTANGLTISVHNGDSDISYATTSNYAGARAEYGVVSALDANGNLSSQVIDNGPSGDGTHILVGYLQGHFSDGNFALPQLQQIGNVPHVVGGADADYIIGNAAANSLDGGGNGDVLDGGAGADTMAGGSGNDSYFVENIGDVVIENPNEGFDTIFATANFTLPANVEALVLQGSADLQGYGSALNDTIYGNLGNNLINGGAGADVMVGGAGSDVYFADNIADAALESANEGNDTVFSTASFGLSANVENLILQGGADLQGYGNALVNTIYGNTGNNLLNGGVGADLMVGGTGNDIYFVDDTSDAAFELPGEGNDVVFSTAHYGLAANVEALVLQGSANLQGYGNNQANTLYGNAGNNLLNGAGGVDLMVGGAGDDTYFVDDPSDACFELASEGNDAVFALCHYGLAADVETLVMLGSGDFQGYGSNQANTLYGNAGNNLLNGVGGGDMMLGGAGNDTYFVDNAGDVVFENANEGADAVFAAVDYTLTANVEALVLQEVGNLSGMGNALANSLFGNGGDNALDGAAGADMLQGNAGNDTFVFRVGEANGDVIADFTGNGAGAGDTLKFVGYGAGATFTQSDATHWQVNFNGGASHEIITLLNGASVHVSDVAFL